MRKYLILIFIFLPIYIYANVTVVTSVIPIKLFLKNIILKQDKAFNLILANANPHVYEPSPKDIKVIKKANIFIGIEKSFDGWIERFLPSNCKLIYLINSNKKNPHIWLSPSIMIKKIDLIVNACCYINKQECEKYRAKGEIFKRRIKKFLKNSPKLNIKVIQFHQAWDYFAKDFSIKIAGTISVHGINISPKKFLQLINLVKNENIKFILVGINYNNSFLHSFADKTNTKIIKLDPIGSDSLSYLGLIKKNIDIIKSFLNYKNN